MFSSNSRIENTNGIVFYEKDILINDNIYNYDMDYSITLDYNSPGFGIIFVNAEQNISQQEYFLFRIGYKEYSIEYKLDSLYQIIKRKTININPITKDMTFSFHKRDNKIIITINNQNINYILPNDINNYKLYIYSNKGNKIKYISANTQIPTGWNITSINNNNGNILFYKDTIKIENSKDDIFIEQDDIELIPNTYYLKYTSSSDSNIILEIVTKDNPEKNILNENNSFTIINKQKVSLRIKGTNGIVSNIFISNYNSDKYVRTYGNGSIIDASKLSVDISSITFAEIHYILKSFYLNNYYIINDNIKDYKINDLNITDLNKEYIFKIDMFSKTISIYNNNNVLLKTINILNINDLNLFYNTEGILNYFYIKTSDNKEFNPIVFKTNMTTIPGNISSPIIVVDENNIPFDLSSSYRYIKDQNIYKFTNTEREIFYKSKHIILTKTPLDIDGSIKIYAIKENLEFDYLKMLTIDTDGLDNIDNFTKNYDILYEKDCLLIDKSNGEIFLDNIDNYYLFIVDYIKNDSYCINYDYLNNNYLIDISTNKSAYYTLFDGEEKDNLININKYKTTDIDPENNKYISLRKKGI